MTDTTRWTGLDAVQVRERLQAVGPNALPVASRRGLLRTALAVATEPMFLLLLVAAAVYLALGDLGEGLLLGFFALMTVGLVVYQERRSERALEALRELAAPQVRVLREGVMTRVPASDLVPGDLFFVGEGERVAADGVLLESAGVSVDESLLTGESVPVRKRALAGVEPAPAGPAEPGGDDQPQVHAGTLVVAGNGLVEVTATGPRTRIGHIGASLATIETAPTPLQLQLARLVRQLAAAGLALSLLMVLWHGLGSGQWLQGVLAGLALAMALLPEEFPMALAVFLALGAWRLAQVRVLARRPAVIEALGGATILCVDKTGTLTENRMRVRRLVAGDADVDVAGLSAQDALPAPVRSLLEFAMLASRRGGVEPMDSAIFLRGDQALAGTAHLHPQWLMVQDYPLTPALLAVSQAWEDGQGGLQVAAKGAPEAIAHLCHLPPDQAAPLLAQAQALAAQGLRVLAVARGSLGSDGRAPGQPLPTDHHDYDFTWLGLVAFEDPLRASVPDAVARARRAGIQVAMITGDHAGTALAIARQAGIDTGPGALTGEHLRAMDDAQLAQAVRQVRVFARVSPQDKLRLVQALRAEGHTVAMTGDGVNDAPALKAAHIGIAMGVRGTDVAREAASVVLLEEDFSRIVEGVAVGRRIFDNLRKVMTYILAIHVPIAGLALLPLLLGLPPLMLPVHVVITEMIIDPVCSLAFERVPAARGLMNRPPRAAGLPLVDWAVVRRAVLQGALVLAFALGLYVWWLAQGASADQARTLAFIVLTMGNLVLVAVNAIEGVGAKAVFSRDFATFWVITVLAGGLLAVAVFVEPVRRLLHFAPLGL